MDTDSSISVQNHKEKRISLVEVSNVERQLWASVHSRGLLNANVQNLYRKACRLYEQILLGNIELEELQEIEYSLWKLHYKNIEEFRKQTSKNPGKEEGELSKNPGNVQERFKLFLEESSRFYQDLISKIKSYYSFQEPTLFYHTNSISRSIDHAKLHKCRFVCHRLLVRLGDLARYLQVNQKPDIQKRNWFAVAKCYFEAAKMYPDDGNPHNQLALLATPTYIGDEFLALYHCVRSIAVKEPFPDASDNLLFIFERNRSVQIRLLSAGSRFNFLEPSERVTTESACYADADFWLLFVRVISFFFLELSLESFSYTFASTIKELEALLALDDAKLSIALESYQNMNISRPGPYRALQAVSILIFTIHNLSRNPEIQYLKKLQMALTATFICMGRVVERCLKGISTDNFALLPAVMVFLEWLVEVLDIVEKSETDEKLMSAMSYFFSSYVELLNQLHECENQVESPNLVALWEDYEMRGFMPVSPCHASLDFLTFWENGADFRAKNEYRVHRVIQAAVKMASRSTDDTQMWIFYEKGGKFCTKEAKALSLSHGLSNGGVAVVEEEEDIVFKPITRHNSSQESGKGLEPPDSDESLRRASLQLIAQNRALIGPLTADTGLGGTQPTSMLSTIMEASSSAGPGPPSLSAWVLNVEKNDSLNNLSNNSHGDRFGFVGSAGDASTSTKCTSSHYYYSAPTPSAPVIPENATWFNAIAGPKSSSFIGNSPPPPWPYPLRDQHNLQWINNQNNGIQRHQFIDPSKEGSPWITHFDQRYPTIPRPAVYRESALSVHPTIPFVNGIYNPRRENSIFYHHMGYERSNSRVYEPVMDVGVDQQQLLQYLKEREWMIQQESQITRSNHTRN